jgi:hypothetical protein
MLPDDGSHQVFLYPRAREQAEDSRYIQARATAPGSSVRRESTEQTRSGRLTRVRDVLRRAGRNAQLKQLPYSAGPQQAGAYVPVHTELLRVGRLRCDRTPMPGLSCVWSQVMVDVPVSPDG